MKGSARVKPSKQLPRLAVFGVGCLAALLALAPQTVLQYGARVCGPSSGGPEVHERFLFPRMAGGAYTLKNGTTMVVSRGLARESTPLPRFFNHPEVVIVSIRRKM